MANADLSINVTANTAAATTNIDKLNKSLVATDKAVKQVTPGVNSAGFALQNLGRVAQDAPFGFIGIQNNLNPLLESFQRLKEEAGSNVGALEALGSSLMGPAGLGIALSLVSSAILLYQKYASKSTDVTKENEEAIKLSISTYDKFLQELEKTSAVAAQESEKVSILFSALSDSNTSLKERGTIIEQLNKISPKYLGNLDKEKSTYEEISKAIFDYTENLAKATEIKAFLPEVDAMFQKLIKTQIELNQLRRFQGGFFGLSDSDFKAEEQRLQSIIKANLNSIKIAKKGLSDFAGGDLNLYDMLFGKEDKPDKKVKEKLDKITPAVQAIFRKWRSEVLPSDMGQGNDVKIIQPSEILNGIMTPDQIKEIQMKSDLFGMSITSGIQDGINTGIEGLRMPQLTALWESSKEQLEKLNEAITESTRSMFEDIAMGMADALGSGTSIAGAFLDALGAGLQQLGRYLIVMSGIIEGIKASIKTFNAALMFAGGLALIVIGAKLKNLKIPGFADGVTNFGGGMAIVGERGPELVRLPKGADVIPNGRVNGMSASGASVFIPAITLRGQDLVIAFNRASQTISRNG